MKINKIQIRHPIFNRNIYLIMIDNKIDKDSLEYLLYVARHGGHRGGIIGIKTHKIIADRIAELYFQLNNQFGLKWYQVSEIHLEMLRNMMVGESKDTLINPRTKNIKKPISNAVLNSLTIKAGIKIVIETSSIFFGFSSFFIL